MSGAPPEDGDAEGRAPKRGRLNIFGELGKLYDAGLQAQKETHEQEMQALREAHKQEVQKLNAHIGTYYDHGSQMAMENKKLREQLQKRGGSVAVSTNSAVAYASLDEPKQVWMIYYQAAHELTKDGVDDAWPGFGLERMELVRLTCMAPSDPPSYVSLLYFKDPQCRYWLHGMLYEIIRSKKFAVVNMFLECTCISEKPYFLSIEVVEMRGVGLSKEKILRHLRDWQKQGPYVWTKNEAPRFPFEQLHA
jgi:regulator of replication initiation timing